MTTTSGAPVAYGLALPDLRGATHLLHPARGDETLWRIERTRVEGRTPVETSVDSRRAVLGMDGGDVEIDRASATTTFRASTLPTDLEVVHPHLASTAVTVAHWAGRIALHAGAVVVDGRVWAVLGERGAGKSTAMYSLVGAGYPLVTDDVLVLDGARVLPGPRCIDLRRPTAEHYGVGEDIGVVGRRRRWRVELPGSGRDDRLDHDLELAGLVHLAWGDHLAVTEVPLDQRWPALLEGLALKLPPADQRGMLRLLALPTVRFQRPQRFAEVDRAAHTLGRELSRWGARRATPAAAG